MNNERRPTVAPILQESRKKLERRGWDANVHSANADQGRGPTEERRKRYEADTADIRGLEAIGIIVFIAAIVGALLTLHWLVPGAT